MLVVVKSLWRGLRSGPLLKCGAWQWDHLVLHLLLDDNQPLYASFVSERPGLLLYELQPGCRNEEWSDVDDWTRVSSVMLLAIWVHEEYTPLLCTRLLCFLFLCLPRNWRTVQVDNVCWQWATCSWTSCPIWVALSCDVEIAVWPKDGSLHWWTFKITNKPECNFPMSH